MLVFTILQLIAIAFTMAIFLIVKDRKDSIRQQPVALLALVGTAENIIYLFLYLIWLLCIDPGKGYDPIPALSGILLSVISYVWKKQGGIDIGHTAANEVLNAVDDGVILLDEKKHLLSYNEAALKVFPELNDDCIGKDVERLKYFPHEILTAGARTEFEVHGSCYECHIKPVHDATGALAGYILFLLDMTETYRYINEIMDTREKAEAANLAKSNFLATMSHEIRTPMNAIVGLSDLIMEESRGRKVYDFACDIKDASSNLLSLINDILDLSKVETGRMELVETDYELKTLIQSMISMLRINASQKGLALKCNIDESLPCVLHGDEKRIRQVLINIINNGLKFTKRGYVQVDVTGEKKIEGQIILHIAVKDTGIGIRKEDFDVIFENFEQVDMKKNRKEEGTGLGLSISKKLMELMHGHIEVESTYGEGSTFTLVLPQKIVDSCPIREYVAEESTVDEDDTLMFKVRNIRVLIVDDNKVNRKVACGMLELYGFKVTEADSGARAIELVKEHMFHLIFMDHMMPEMDGIETTRIIRSACGENGKNAVIIALTANAMEGAREMFLRNGFQDFLPKPIERKTMHDMLLKYVPQNRRVIIEEEVEDELVTEDEMASVFMTGVDVRKAMEHHSGTIDDYLELLELYYMDGTKKVGLLSDYVEKHDAKNYQIEVHGIKSASANIGASEVAMLMLSHEHAAQDEDWDFIEGHIVELLKAYKALLKEIKRVLEKKEYAGNSPQKEGKEMLSDGELCDKIRKALELLENFKSKECAKAVEELLTYGMDEFVYKLLKEVQMKLKMYEDDEAEELLASAIDRLSS